VNLTARIGQEEYDLEIRPDPEGGYRIRIGDRESHVQLTEPEENLYSLLLGESSYEALVRLGDASVNVDVAGRRFEVGIRDPLAAGTENNGSSGGVQVIRSVMAGKVLHVMVSEGDRVATGDPLLVIEAMKMENEICSPKDGTVQAIRVSAGETVETNAELAIIE
jgi:biotin carboxyl carrier protein